MLSFASIHEAWQIQLVILHFKRCQRCCWLCVTSDQRNVDDYVLKINFQCLWHHSSMFCSRDMQVLILSKRVITSKMEMQIQVQNNSRHKTSVFLWIHPARESHCLNKSDSERNLKNRMSGLHQALLMFAFLCSMCTIQILHCSLTHATLLCITPWIQCNPLLSHLTVVYDIFKDRALKS